MAPIRRPTASRLPAATLLVAVGVASLAVWFAPQDSFAVSSPLSPLVTSPSDFVGRRGVSRGESESLVALHANGPKPYDSVAKTTTKGLKRALLRKMPSTRLSTETIMKRITTILIKNMQETWRLAPMRTREIMKEVGLQGRQIKEKESINKALDLLQAQKVIHKYKQNPIRWEIHEEYRKYGVPVISWDKRDPWRFTYLLNFDRVKTPTHGPAHGLYRPKDRDFLIEHNLPLASIHDPIMRPDPYVTGDFTLRQPKPKPGERKPRFSERLPQPPVNKEGKMVQHDWELLKDKDD